MGKGGDKSAVSLAATSTSDFPSMPFSTKSRTKARRPEPGVPMTK